MQDFVHQQYHDAPNPLRLAVILVLQGNFQRLFVSMGTVCSSWVLMSKGSTQRDYITPGGNAEHPSVRAGNCMVGRSTVFSTYYLCLDGVGLGPRQG